MSALAAYNEFSDKLIKFLNTTTGRDRVNGLVQFIAQFLMWWTARKGYAVETVTSWKNLMSAVATSRRLFRIGRSSEFMRAISKSSAIRDDTLRYLTIIRSLALSLWLSNDALIWLHAVGVRNYDNIKDITTRANRFWLAGAMCGVAADIYRMQQNGIQMQRARATMGNELVEESDKKVVSVDSLMVQRKELQLQTLQDSLEATLAATLLNYVELEPGTFALVGFVATALGFRTHWKAVNA